MSNLQKFLDKMAKNHDEFEYVESIIFTSRKELIEELDKATSEELLTAYVVIKSDQEQQKLSFISDMICNVSIHNDLHELYQKDGIAGYTFGYLKIIESILDKEHIDVNKLSVYLGNSYDENLFYFTSPVFYAILNKDFDTIDIFLDYGLSPDLISYDPNKLMYRTIFEILIDYFPNDLLVDRLINEGAIVSDYIYREDISSISLIEEYWQNYSLLGKIINSENINDAIKSPEFLCPCMNNNLNSHYIQGEMITLDIVEA